MAITPTVLYRAAAPTTLGGLYTTPSGVTVLTNMVVTNNSASSATFGVTISGFYVIASGSTVGPNTTAFFDLKQVVTSGTTVSGIASAATVTFNFSGVNIV